MKAFPNGQTDFFAIKDDYMMQGNITQQKRGSN